MSEQTPTSTEDLNGAEPSMEDILASIRKIISEDEPVAMESPEDVMPVELVNEETLSTFGDSSTDVPSDAVLDVADSVSDRGGSVDLNIDDVLAGLDDDLDASESFSPEDLEIPEIPADATEDFSVDSLMSELEAPAALNDTALPEVAAAGDEASLNNDDDVFAFLNAETATAAGAAGLAGAAVAAGAGALTGDDVSPEAMPEISDLLESVDIESDVTPISENLLSESSHNDDVEMDALLDDILLSSDEAEAEVEAEGIDDILDAGSLDLISSETADEELAVDDLLDELADEPEGMSETEQSDLELVKSLMAELADNPSYEEIDALNAELEIDDTSDTTLEEETETSDVITSEAEEEDILGDILDMSLEDELQSQPEDLDLQDNLELNDLIDETTELGDLDLGDLASLDDVAAAEQENVLENLLDDAASVDDTDSTILAPTAAAAGLTAAAGAGLAALADTANVEAEIEAVAELESLMDDEAVEMAETSTDTQIETQTETQSFSNQETSMPVKAVQTDAIIDEVTETATIGAFAELNQVVEDKAVFNERGPRIGDLVQDALRPMLKEWLDANLKGIVERAVTKEVKRISKG